MKKGIAILVTLAMVLGLCACGAKNEAPAATQATAQTGTEAPAAVEAPTETAGT